MSTLVCFISFFSLCSSVPLFSSLFVLVGGGELRVRVINRGRETPAGRGQGVSEGGAAMIEGRSTIPPSTLHLVPHDVEMFEVVAHGYQHIDIRASLQAKCVCVGGAGGSGLRLDPQGTCLSKR